MKLSELDYKQTGVITKILDSHISIILIERGFYPGQNITLYQSDIFNDVKIFDIGAKFMLRKSEYEIIEIELLN